MHTGMISRPPVTIGIETTGYTQWFHALMHRLGHTVLVGEAGKIRAMVVRKTKTDRRDARHLLDLLKHDRFPSVWIPDNGDVSTWIRIELARALVATQRTGIDRTSARSSWLTIISSYLEPGPASTRAW